MEGSYQATTPDLVAETTPNSSQTFESRNAVPCFFTCMRLCWWLANRSALASYLKTNNPCRHFNMYLPTMLKKPSLPDLTFKNAQETWNASDPGCFQVVAKLTILSPRLGAEWIGRISWLPRAPLGPIFMTGLYSVQSIVPTIVLVDLS